MPAIKGFIYILTHFLTSKPALIKLDNENIGGHLTPLHYRPPKFSLRDKFYRLPFLAIFGTVRPHFLRYTGQIWRGSVVLGRPLPGKILYKSNNGIYSFWGKFIPYLPKITIFGDF